MKSRILVVEDDGNLSGRARDRCIKSSFQEAKTEPGLMLAGRRMREHEQTEDRDDT